MATGCQEGLPQNPNPSWSFNKINPNRGTFEYSKVSWDTLELRTGINQLGFQHFDHKVAFPGVPEGFMETDYQVGNPQNPYSALSVIKNSVFFLISIQVSLHIY